MEPKTHTLPFGKFTTYENYIIGEPNEFEDMGIAQARQVIDEIACKYKGDWGYIGNRVNKNSVDPMVYIFARKECPNFKTMAVVTYSHYAEKFAEIEKSVAESVDLDFQQFQELNESIAWMKQKMSAKKKSERLV